MNTRPNITTKDVLIALITKEIARYFGSSEPGTMDKEQIYMRNILWSSKYPNTYIFRNHITERHTLIAYPKFTFIFFRSLPERAAVVFIDQPS